MPKGKRYSAEQIITKLREAEILLSQGKSVEEAASGLPKIRFHDLRHTSASLMLNHGIPVIIVSQRLGHNKPSVTSDVYGHIIPGKQEEAARLLDSLMPLS